MCLSVINSLAGQILQCRGNKHLKLQAEVSLCILAFQLDHSTKIIEENLYDFNAAVHGPGYDQPWWKALDVTIQKRSKILTKQ